MKPISHDRRYGTLSNARWVLHTIRQYDRHHLLKCAAELGMELAMPAFASLLPALAVSLVTRNAGFPVYLLAMALACGACALLAFLIQALTARIYGRMRLALLLGTFSEYMRKFLTMDYAFLSQNAGRLALSRAHRAQFRGGETGINGLTLQLRTWLQSLLGLLLFGGAAASLDIRILLILLAMSASSMAFAALQRRFDRAQESEWRKNWHVFEYLTLKSQSHEHGKDARLYRMEKWLADAMRDRSERIIAQLRRSRGLRFAGDAVSCIFLLARDLIAYSVLIHHFFEGRIDAAGFTLMLGLISSFSAQLSSFVSSDNLLREYSQETDHVRSFLDIPDASRPNGLENLSSLSRPLAIELRDVSFTYPDADKPSLSHVSLTIRPGERIALVGMNGAGKTTLVKLLCGLYPPDEGEILVSGVPLQRIRPESWRQLVATVFQDVILLPLTVAQTVACCEEFDEARVLECLEQAGVLSAVLALPKGIHTNLTRHIDLNGSELSGGQTQRLFLARALYHGGDLLLLDEPTAALDPLAEAALYAQYADMTQGKTSVFISHRLSSTQLCDRVLYMEGGQIVESGSHNELMALQGRYARMFAVQSQYYQQEGDTADEKRAD